MQSGYVTSWSTVVLEMLIIIELVDKCSCLKWIMEVQYNIHKSSPLSQIYAEELPLLEVLLVFSTMVI
jgi:hypothetical protein